MGRVHRSGARREDLESAWFWPFSSAPTHTRSSPVVVVHAPLAVSCGAATPPALPSVPSAQRVGIFAPDRRPLDCFRSPWRRDQTRRPGPAPPPALGMSFGVACAESLIDPTDCLVEFLEHLMTPVVA